MSFDLRDLPDGWIQEMDPGTKHPFWVDTRAHPARSIWVHPYEDEQFLREHPDLRDRIAHGGLARPSSEAPPAYSPRRHSVSGSSRPSRSNNLAPPKTDARPTSQPGTPSEKGMSGRHHQGFFDKLKSKMHQSRPSYGGAGYGGAGYGRPSYQQAYGQQYQPSYAAPAGAPSSSSFRRYAPLVGGMGAGFLLGEMLDGPGLFGGPGLFDGGFGGGGFGGGGFGGGGFGGGGFDNGFGGGGFDNGFGGGGGFF